VAVERDPPEPARGSGRQDGDPAAAPRVPHGDGAAGVDRGEPPAVAAERRLLDPPSLAAQPRDRPPGGDVPERGRARRDDHGAAAVARERRGARVARARKRSLRRHDARAPPQRGARLGRVGGAPGLDREQRREVVVAAQGGRGARRQLARPGQLLVALGARRLLERLDGEPPDHRDGDHGGHRQHAQQAPPVGRLRGRLLVRDAPLRLVRRTPGEHRVGQHVVVDLVAAVAHGAEDAGVAAGQPLEDGDHARHRDPGPVAEVGRRVGDLRPRASHEVLERAGGHVPLRRRQCAHRGVEVRADDALRVAELLQRREAHDRRAAARLLLPQPAEHELDVRRLHLPRGPADPAAGRVADLELAGLHLVQHRLDELRVDVRRPGAGLHRGEVLERLDDRVAPGARSRCSMRR
jgi:hypothetical protein